MASSVSEIQTLPSNHNSSPDSESSPDQILTALEDADCRSVLEATASTPRTAKELANSCDVPKSTLYRKLDILTDTGLLEEHIRLCKNGKQAKQFKRAFKDITISTTNQGDFTVEIS